MSEEKETDKEIKVVLDRLYQTEVATNNLKYDFELRIAKTRTEYITHYKGKELKESINRLVAIREERLDIIDKARVDVQIGIVKEYVKREMGK